MDLDKDENWYLVIVNTPERRAQNLPPLMRTTQAEHGVWVGHRPKLPQFPAAKTEIIGRLSSGGPEWFSRRSFQVVGMDVDESTFDHMMAQGWKHEPDWSTPQTATMAAA